MKTDALVEVADYCRESLRTAQHLTEHAIKHLGPGIDDTLRGRLREAVEYMVEAQEPFSRVPALSWWKRTFSLRKHLIDIIQETRGNLILLCLLLDGWEQDERVVMRPEDREVLKTLNCILRPAERIIMNHFPSAMESHRARR